GVLRDIVAAWTETVQSSREAGQNCTGKPARLRGKASDLRAMTSGKRENPPGKQDIAENMRKQALCSRPAVGPSRITALANILDRNSKVCFHKRRIMKRLRKARRAQPRARSGV